MLQIIWFQSETRDEKNYITEYMGETKNSNPHYADQFT
jgi:hypothetical protein